VLMVSHDAEDARVLAHQHWYMRQGKLLREVVHLDEEQEMLA